MAVRLGAAAPLLPLAFLLLCEPGCASRPSGPPPEAAALQEPCCAAPCRRHIQVFLVQGLDPLDLANFAGIQERLRCRGDCVVFQFHQSEGDQLTAAVRAAHRAAPNDPIALVGFSLGCGPVRRAANTLHAEDGICPGLVFYIGGWFLEDNAESRPPYVPHVVHVLGAGCDRAGKPLTGAENLQLNSNHYATPTHPATLGRLDAALDRLAHSPGAEMRVGP